MQSNTHTIEKIMQSNKPHTIEEALDKLKSKWPSYIRKQDLSNIEGCQKSFEHFFVTYLKNYLEIRKDYDNYIGIPLSIVIAQNTYSISEIMNIPYRLELFETYIQSTSVFKVKSLNNGVKETKMVEHSPESLNKTLKLIEAFKQSAEFKKVDQIKNDLDKLMVIYNTHFINDGLDIHVRQIKQPNAFFKDPKTKAILNTNIDIIPAILVLCVKLHKYSNLQNELIRLGLAHDTIYSIHDNIQTALGEEVMSLDCDNQIRYFHNICKDLDKNSEKLKKYEKFSMGVGGLNQMQRDYYMGVH
jgi:hypothetical protein